jgi:hypothetical protein
MNIARVEKTNEFKYKLSRKNIERVQKVKDIGVTIDSELTFESYICEKVNKATPIFGATITHSIRNKLPATSALSEKKLDLKLYFDQFS